MTWWTSLAATVPENRTGARIPLTFDDSHTEIIARDKANLDIQWSPSVADTPKGNTPQTLMQEILDDLAEAMREFADVESEIGRSERKGP